MSIDCVYIAASSYDSRYTRICVASIRFFYPDIPIRLLIGGRIRSALLEELKRDWGVEISVVPPANYGWGFIKLEPLFFNQPERFLILDSDTIFIGAVLDVAIQSEADFVVDDEVQSEEDTRRLYYDWKSVRTIDPSALPPEFVFNSGQWFGTSGVLQRRDFSNWVQWDWPRTLKYPDIFMPGEQGILNYVLNQQARLGKLMVDRLKLMRWPGHDLSDIDLSAVRRGKCSPYPQVIHWAGVKAPRLEMLPRSDLLLYFERLYYDRNGGGEKLRITRARKYEVEYRIRQFTVKVRQRLTSVFS